MRALVDAQKSVLLVTNNNMALEHILNKFKETNDNFIKISSGSVAEESLRPHTTKELAKTADTLAKLSEIYNKVSLKGYQSTYIPSPNVTLRSSLTGFMYL